MNRSINAVLRGAIGALVGALAVAGAQAQRADLRFQTLSLEDGLPQVFVTSVARDSLGFVWFGTAGGLARYDGYRFDVFEPDPADPGSLPDPIVRDLMVASDGTLWVGFEVAGAARFDPASEAFVRVPVGEATEGGLPHPQVNVLYEAADGAVWFGTDGGLARLDAATGRMTHLRAPGPFRPTALADAGTGGLWVGSLDGLFLADAPGQALTPLDLGPEVSNTIWDMREVAGRLWLATQEGLAVYDPASGRARGFAAPELRERTDALFAEPNGWLWATTRSGFVLVDTNTEEVLTVRSNAPGNPIALPTARVLDLLYDRAGFFWVATAGAGAAVADFRTSRLPVIRADPDDPAALASPSLRSIESDSVSIWAGLNNLGLNRIDRATGRVQRFPLPVPPASFASALLREPTVFGLDRDRSGALWSVVWWGVQRHAPGGAVERRFPFQARAQWAANPAFVHEDRTGRLWVGTEALLLLDPASGRFTEVLDLPVRAVHEAADGALWLASDAGLVRYEPGTGASAAFRHDPADGGSLTSDETISMAAQGDSVLWVGTVAGLNRVSMATGRVQRYTRAASGLPNNYVNGVLVDDGGAVWVSTNRGLARVDPDTEVVSVLPVGRGLQGLEYNRGAAHKAADGTLMFGGIDGLNVFDPATLRDNPFPPEVRLRRLVAGDEAVVPGPGALDPGGTVRLRPDQDVLTFEFVGLHYAAPGANRYQYRLEGVDADWQPLSTVREARYTRVPPGTHTFRVRAASAYGVWSDEVALATVVLPPAWWASAWFRGLLLLLGVGIAVAAYRWRTADLRDRERLLEAQVAARTDALRQAQMRTELQSVELERLNRQQRRLFANVSHETRTPLTLILGPVEDALAEADLPGRLRRTLEGVRRNGRRLLHLVDQILDLARLEAGGATLSLRPIDLGDFTTTLSGVFEEYAEGRGVDLQVEIPEAPLVGRFDVSLLEHVLFNLLSNAIKFTPAGGRVTVRLGAEAAPLPEAAPLAEAEAGAPAPEAPQIAVLVVEDTGVGIPPDDVGEVFERFALAHTGQGSGTGLGLALVKEAVEQHGGTVEVESELGRGSAFAVRLPLDATTRVEGRGDSYVLSDRIPELVVAARAEDGDDAADRTTVLVADDDPGVRAYVADVLRPAYRVLEAEDGAAALDLARDALPDLVVSDVVMPALDGLGLCVALREDPALRYVPVVLLTARVDVEDRLAGLEAGADDYLAKPFDARELRARVDNLIAARRAWRTEAAPAPFRDAFPEAVSADDQLRQRIDGVVHERFAEPGFGAGDLAEAVGLSGSQLRRRMQALYGQSPSQVVRAYRLQQGAGLLARQTGTVAEVAYAVGFNSVSYFTRAFGEAYGQTPTEYAAAAAEQG